MIENVWALNYECPRPNGVPQDSRLIYEAATPQEAIAGALRWMKGRTEALPEFFPSFLYFQISPYPIGTIGEKGELRSGGAMRIMEWSCDRAGVDMETYCAWKIAEFDRRKT